MAQPPAYTPATDFSDEERDNVGGRSTVRTAALDAELSAIATTTDAIRTVIALNQRDDGEIRDGRVKLFTLAQDVLALLTAYGATPRGNWQTATAYNFKDLVSQGGFTYMAVSAHVSGVFATDLAAQKWLLFSLGAAPNASSIPFTPTGTILASQVQAAIEESDTENRALSAAVASGLAAYIADVANFSLNTKGAALMGFGPGLVYPPNSIGAAVAALVGSTQSVGYKRLKADYGAVGNGVIDDTAALVAAIAAVPDGGTLVLDGLFRITSTVTINRRVSLWCFGMDQGILLDCGPTTDGIVYYGTDPALLNGINGLDVRLNVYGRAACCEHAVTLQRFDRSRARIVVRAGASAYAFRIRGCLIDELQLDSSTNYFPPITGFGTPANHCLVENFGYPLTAGSVCAVSGPASPGVVTLNAHGFSADQPVVFIGATKPPAPFALGRPYFVLSAGLTANTFRLATRRGGTAINTSGAGSSPTISTCTPVATNSVEAWVNFEGTTGDGLVQTTMPGEGSNTYRGEIEGIGGGRPIYIEECAGVNIRDLRMEANVQAAYILGAENIKIGPGVVYYGDLTHSNVLTLQNCTGYDIEGYTGNLNIDSTNHGGGIGEICTTDVTGIAIADTGCVQRSGIKLLALASTPADNPVAMIGGPGFPTMQTLYPNPFFDIWDSFDPTIGPGLNVTMEGAYTAGDITRELSTVYPRSPSATALRCISRGTTINNGAKITPGVQPNTGAEWWSFLLPIYMLSSTYRAMVYLDDGVSVVLLGQTKTSGVYEEIRASCRPAVGANWVIRVAIVVASSGAYASGVQYYLGGFNPVKGPVPPATIENSHGRMHYVGSSVGFAPFRRGAIAMVGATEYLASSNTVAGDWRQIYP